MVIPDSLSQSTGELSGGVGVEPADVLAKNGSVECQLDFVDLYTQERGGEGRGGEGRENRGLIRHTITCTYMPIHIHVTCRYNGVHPYIVTSK